MAEGLRRRKEEQKPASSDILGMISRASASIREHIPSTVPVSTEPQRMLDPLIYGAPASQRKQATAPPQQIPRAPIVTEERPRTRRPLVTDEVLREFDGIYRPSATQTPQRQSRPTHVPSPQTAEVLPMPAEQPEVTGVVETSETIRPPIPAPNTKEAAIFEFELKNAYYIIQTAIQNGYKPQLIRSEFSPEAVNFLVACGQGEYFVDKAHPQVVSIELLAAQATQAVAPPQTPAKSRRSLLPARSEHTDKSSTERRRMGPKTRKRLIGAAVCALTPFGLFTASYAATAEFVCKPDALAAKAACGALALNASLIDVTPLINTYAHIVDYPVEVYRSIVDKDDNPEGPR